MKKKSIFPNSGSTKKHHCIYQGGSLVYTELENNVFLKYSGGKNLPINPQPKTDDILILRKYYVTLKRAAEYKERITQVEQFPASKQNLKALAILAISLTPLLSTETANPPTLNM